MRVDPMEEWRRLTQLYAEMGDEELEDLACGFSDLTETAREVLRSEMRKRGLGDPQAPKAGGRDFDFARRSGPGAYAFGGAKAIGGKRGEFAGDDAAELARKTLLCQCESGEEAWQLSEMLRRAGIESWTETPISYSQHPELLAERKPQVLVAAGDMERALTIAAQPVPQEIVEQSRSGQPEYEPPVCPRCGAADPVLEGVNPANAWRCESCGREWTEAAGADAQAEDAAR